MPQIHCALTSRNNAAYLPLTNLHASIALQECEILTLSLKDNITLFKQIPDDKLQKVIEIAQLRPVIERLPDGLDTIVGEKGQSISGGERQRVSLARAIVDSPELLILDEATSMLDAANEARFFSSLFDLLPSVTLILITHHERSLSFVSRTLRFEGGHVTNL